MLNPPAERECAYDSGIVNWFDPSLIQKLPVSMKPGDSLVSTMSMMLGQPVRPPMALPVSSTDAKGFVTRRSR
jgi:hypothetical protein